MKLDYLLQPWITSNIPSCEILGLQNDSRKLRLGDVFIAYPGAAADGRKFIAQAIKQGARAVIYEPSDFPAEISLPDSVPCLALPQLASRLAALADRFYQHPSERLSIAGVTGTNGKTTIAYLLAQAHELLGRHAAYIGTLGHGQVPNLQPLNNTTPDALEVQHLLHIYQNEGFQQMCMEVSSHALEQHRVDHVVFHEAIYTNLSHEHLDYHQTMEAYAQAKARLFAKTSLKWVILNYDDAYVSHMAAAVPKGVQQWTYGMQKGADVRVINYQLHSHNSEFTVVSPWGQHDVTIPSLGLFNIYNNLAVYTSLLANGYPASSVIEILANLQATPGRMEIVARNPTVIVDFAHTPVALDNVIKTLNSLKKSEKVKLWVVFGCGGNRDKTKRPLMAKTVSSQADYVIVTSDNPRKEDPEAIIQDISVGLVPGASVTTIADRRDAIHYALNTAGKDDIVLIAGKGHENYQIIGDEHLHFSDQEEVRGWGKIK